MVTNYKDEKLQAKIARELAEELAFETYREQLQIQAWGDIDE